MDVTRETARKPLAAVYAAQNPNHTERIIARFTDGAELILVSRSVIGRWNWASRRPGPEDGNLFHKITLHATERSARSPMAWSYPSEQAVKIERRRPDANPHDDR